MPITVTVIVSGGNVQDCYSDSPDVRIEMIDYDNIKEEGQDAMLKADLRLEEIQQIMHHIY
jgi:hypothetical protein